MTTRYSKDHEWVRVEGDTATIGISDHAQSQLGDIVYVELPEAGKTVKQGDAVAVVESVKAASDIYAVVSGTISERNESGETDPSLINSDPEGAGWLFKMTISDNGELADLMDEAAYKSYCESLD